MENTNLNNSAESQNLSQENSKKSNKGLLLGISAIVLVLVIVSSVAYVLYKNNQKKEDLLNSVDASITTIDSLLEDTDSLENDLYDLPENFLDSEPVSTNEIDNVISDLDDQMDSLDDLDSDFELEESDVGL